MSDLQCPARIVVLRRDAPVDVALLHAERPVRVYTELVDDGADVARDLTLPRVALRDDGAPPGTTALPAALREVADECRGECVVALVERAAFRRLADDVLPPAAGPVSGILATIDADGETWVPWPGGRQTD